MPYDPHHRAGTRPHSRRSGGPFVLLIAAVLGACGAAGDSLGGDALSGVARLELREAFRLGGLEAPEEETFQRAPQLVVDATGTAYVLHRDLGRVGVFDAQGTFVRWIGGGQGEGPGEFTFPSGIGLLADTLWIRNLSPPWISRFLSDGTHVETDRLVVEADYMTTMGVQGVSGYLDGGRAWMEPAGFVMGGEADARAPFILGDRAMERQDTLFSWRAGRGRLGGTSFGPVPEPPFHDVAPDGSGMVIAEWSDSTADVLTIRLVDPDGSDRRSLRLPVRPLPLPASVRDSLIAAGRDQVAGVRQRLIEQGLPAERAPSVPSAADVRETVYLPDYIPPIRAVRLGIDGTIWLQRMDGLDEGPWVVLDADGTPLFEVVLPDSARFRHASREAVWGTVTGPFDVPYVVRWSVTGGTATR